MKNLLLVLGVALAAQLLSTGILQAQVPQLVNYQGRVAVGTTNFNGSGRFKFALVNSNASATYWSNDGTSAAGSEPAAAVTLPVTKGLYSVLLGDATLTNMTTIPATVFANADVRLRVWFDDGVNGSQLLAPDQRLAAVGYALMAGSVSDGAITSAKIAGGAVGSSQLAAGAVTAAQIAPGAVGSAQLAVNSVQATNLAPGAAGAQQTTVAKGVLVHLGDSNTYGRPGWRVAYESEWLVAGGIFDGWTSYNLGQNGSTLDNWVDIEIPNVDNPTYSELAPHDYGLAPYLGDPGAGRLARAINANPDVIVLSLGTNDLNTPAGRSTIGTEANLRSNLATLVNFLMARTHATLILRMPQPFAYGLMSTKTASITNGSPVVTTASTSGLSTGLYASGAGIASNTFVASVNSGTQITLSSASSVSNASATLNFANDSFFSLTQWVDAAECAEASRRLRVVYQEWIGRNTRVQVYDSHTSLFGNTCVNSTVDCQDPWLGTGNPLVADGLHPTDLGYRREVQQIAMMLNPSLAKNPRIDFVAPVIPLTSTWSTTLYVSGSGVAGGAPQYFEVEITPEAAVMGDTARQVVGPTGQASAAFTAYKKNYPERKQFVDLVKALGGYSGFQQLLNVPDKSDLWAFSHANRSIVRLSNVMVNQIVSLADNIYPYAIVVFSGSDLSGLGGGLVTFFTKNANNVPFRPPTLLTASLTSNAPKVIGSPTPSGFILHGLRAFRKSVSGASAAVISVHLQNQGDGRYVSSTENFAAPGKRIGTITHTIYVAGAELVFDAVNYPGGNATIGPNDLVRIQIDTGDINADYGGSVELYLRDN